MKIPFLICLAWSTAAKAQGSGEVYAAPGMRVHLQTRALPKKGRAKPAAIPAIVPRFWHSADSVAWQTGYIQYLQALQHFMKFPVEALREQVEGRLFVRAILSAEGLPIKVEVVKRNLTTTASHAILNAFDAEAARVVGALRFEPKAGLPDTIIIQMSYFMQ
ncbi:hypothetical protein [Hymenobacter negativus]|uniref:TonB C-terminal domain-containing protein n=1 Tax=Hymenobacter negativus TaxID=2795026 RepID=A0ABS3QKC4_9BACT|nr:hypothetical protein [Hymenobacter negativus]MBO2011140.1 hypothetical protein [Hymenobacter negativus]